MLKNFKNVDLDQNIRKIGIFVADPNRFPNFVSNLKKKLSSFRFLLVVRVGRDDIIRELILYTILLREARTS